MAPAPRRGLLLVAGLVLVNVLGASAIAAQSSVSMRGFGEVGFVSGTEGAPSSFGLGQLDNYVAGTVSDRIDFLSEVVVEYADGWIVDLERLWVRYAVSSRASISAGKFHTPIGHWNRAYHHGALLQPSVDRPDLFAFEDEGGALPIHTTGLLLAVSNLGAAEFGFDLTVGNGIGGDPVSDDNGAKAVGLRAYAHPVPGLTVGVSGYRDHLDAGTARPTGSGAIDTDLDQRILAGDVRIRTGRVDLISEAIRATNEGSSLYSSWGYYSLLSYSVTERWSAYGKIDELRFDPDDPYYESEDLRAFAIGFAFSPALLAAVKGELRRTTFRSGAPSETTLNLSMSFGW